MKLCTPHWEELRTAVRDRGLEPFVSRSGEEAARKLANGPPRDRASFDPLLRANIAIVEHVVGAAGPVKAAEWSATDACPICYFSDHCDVCREHSARWITLATDEQLALAKVLGLVTSS
jgi:hypothetical protein